MRQIYTNEDQISAMNSRNALEAVSISVEVKNEYTAGGAIPGASIWLELWVDDSDYERAVKILEKSSVKLELNDWVCEKCNERNPGNFSIC